MNERLVKLLVGVLPVLSAGLYLLGLTYHQGYLSAYRIDESLYPLAVDRALFTGLFALVGVSFPGVIYGLGALCLFVLSVLIAALLSSSSRVRSFVEATLRRFPRWRLSHPPLASTTTLLDRSFLVYGYSTGFVVLLVALLLMAILSSKRGTEQANLEMKEFKANHSWRTSVVAEQPGVPSNAQLVMCGEHWCSFWSGTEAISVRRDLISRLTSTAPAPNASSSGAQRSSSPASAASAR